MTQRPPPLTPDEAASILGRIEEVVATNEVVLIGGQAVAIWATQLVEYLGAEFDQTAVASSDVDFQGAEGPLRRAAELLGGTLWMAVIDDVSPMVGMAVFQDSEGYERELDFLPKPHGLMARDVAKSAIRIHVKHPDRHEIPLWIIHPQRCLESRIVNSGLPGKDTPLAWAQVRASIGCARAFSRAQLDVAEGTPALAETCRTVLKLNERTFKFARDNIFARQVALEREIDCFDAVLCDPRLGERFVVNAG